MTPRCDSRFHSAGCRLFQGHGGPHQSWYGEEWHSDKADRFDNLGAAHSTPPMTTPELSPLNEQEFEYIEHWLLGVSGAMSPTRDTIRRLIAQARAARPSPWQSIETADPSADILVSDGVDVGDGWFSKDTRRWRLQHKLGSRPVTHWMPKPSPPAQDGGRS